jgi:hypothetical protein
MNTDVPRVIAANPQSLKCQVRLSPKDHAFVDHECHLDCTRVREFQTSEVLAQLADHPEWVLGTVTADLLMDVKSALQHSPTIRPQVQTRLSTAIDDIAALLAKPKS